MGRPIDQVFGFEPRYPEETEPLAVEPERTPSHHARKTARDKASLAGRIEQLCADDAPARIKADGSTRVCIMMPTDLHRRCKVFCAQNGMSMNLLLSEIWADLDDALDELGA